MRKPRPRTQDSVQTAAPTRSGWDSEAGGSLGLSQVSQTLVVRTCLRTQMEPGLVAALLAPALGGEQVPGQPGLPSEP